MATKQGKEKTAAANNKTSGGEKSSGWLAVIWEWSKSIVFALVLALLIRWPVAEPFKIPSGSMETTLHGDERFGRGDRIFVNKHAYGVRYPFNGFRFPWMEESLWYSDKWLWEGSLPERWDIAVFKSIEERAEHDTLVKRVVALSGEHVLIQNGMLFIDGEPIELPDFMPDVRYTNPPYRDSSFGGYGMPGADEAHSVVPEGHVFLLGDNSGNSKDARWWGWVPHHHLVGEATSIWWPVSRWRDFTGFSRSWWWIGGWILFGTWLVTRMFFGRSWKLREDWLGSIVQKGQRLFIRFSLGIPIPVTRLRMTRGRELARGDLVLYRPLSQERDLPEYVLGVVAALPGERVFLDQGKISINDKPVDSPAWLTEMEFSREGVEGKYARSKGKEYSLVPKDEYCILVNGAERAWDSRTVGWISRKRILGHAATVWWPSGARKRLGAKTPDVR